MIGAGMTIAAAKNRIEQIIRIERSLQLSAGALPAWSRTLF
jgi:hypothetical protein